jgi:heptosyltransferase-2/heptosyltransferase-3
MLRESLPDTHLTLAVGPWNRELAARFPWVDDVLEVDFPWFNRQPKPTPWSPYVRLMTEARRWRQRAFDTAIVLRFDFWWGALLSAAAAIPRRIGYALPEVAPLLTDAIPYESDHHEVVQNVRLLQRGLGLTDERRWPLEFPITREEHAWAKEALPDERWAMLLVGAGAAVKLWPPEAFAEVGTFLTRERGLRLVVAGGPTDAGRVNAVRSALSIASTPLVNATLGQLAAALTRCSVAVGADSGPMHLAVAVGTPTVHLYGPVSVTAFGPWGDARRHRTVVSPLSCVPCNRLDYSQAELPLHPCIREMPAAWVKQECDAALREAAGAHRD